MKPKPHTALRYVSPDTIAECWDGVSDKLRRDLWMIVKFIEPIPNKEDSGPADHVGHGSVASLWGYVDPEMAEELNKLAAAEEAAWEQRSRS